MLTTRRFTLYGALVAITVVVTFALCLWVFGAWHDSWSGWNSQFAVSDGICNIAVIPVIGSILPYPETDEEGEAFALTVADDVIAYLRQAEYDSNIYGALIRIDSSGGTPVASEVIMDALKASPLPTAALIRELGTSGAYLAATGADTIIASPLSDVGGIGISMSYLDYSRQNAQEGIRYVSLISAPYKDYGDPNKPLTGEERAIVERDLAVYHDLFVKAVAKNRGLEETTVATLADGSSLPGPLALDAGLVDDLGNQDTARAWFAEELGATPSDIIFCENYW